MNSAAANATLTIREGQFWRRDHELAEAENAVRPHRIIAGAVHYFRVHPAQWRDRLLSLRALGFNTIETYVAWNFHQPRHNIMSFDEWQGTPGWADVAAFIHLAGTLDFDVIVRPGPYICSEWDNGGIPAFVTDTPRLRPRCYDPKYLACVAAWFDELLPQLVPLQANQGGPIVAFQAENEYGSYGDDARYMQWCVSALRERGVTELIYTADGPTVWMLDGGTVADPTVPATATFGTGVADAATLLAARRPAEPFMCAEFWNGWFDHWGEHHHTRDPQEVAHITQEILAARDNTGSISVYMAHGGTNFALTSGANHDGTTFQPTITSYDSDAPLAEDGSITPKGIALAQVFAQALNPHEPPPSAEAIVERAPQRPKVQPATTLTPVIRGSWCDSMAQITGWQRSAYPPTFADLGLPQGALLLVAQPLLTAEPLTLTLRGLHDDAYVWLDGEYLGRFNETTGLEGLPVRAAAASATHGQRCELKILVVNRGRINYGPRFGEGKGILDGVYVGQRLVHDWQCAALPLDELEPTQLAQALMGIAEHSPSAGESMGATALARLNVTDIDPETGHPGDAFLEFKGFTRGYCFVNGFLLGRYDSDGPQVTYYVPGPLLRVGTNVIVMLELEQPGTAILVREVADLGNTTPPRTQPEQ